MKLIIDIPDEVLKSRHYCRYFGAWSTKLTETIENGIPCDETFTKDEYEGAYLRGYVDSAKANEPPKGEWLLRNSGCIQWIRCSVCNKHQHYKDTSNFCPNCGAKMSEHGILGQPTLRFINGECDYICNPKENNK